MIFSFKPGQNRLALRNGGWKRALILVLVGLGITVFAVYRPDRPTPAPVKSSLYPGVEYERQVWISPRPVIIHIITVDTETEGLSFLVTPHDDLNGEHPLYARTTSAFLEEFDLQLAINGDNFSPWWSRTPWDYYPHSGDPVSVRGEAASHGILYSQEQGKPRPTLYISSDNRPSFETPPEIYNAISGESMLVVAGEIVTDREDPVRHPRSMIGYSKDRRFLYLVVVDGRQPWYSVGLDLGESAQLMIDIGAYDAMNLDGGGSATLVVEGSDGQPQILNSPIDNYIPGRERPVANHLGIYVSE